jgi:hypothetical protein
MRGRPELAAAPAALHQILVQSLPVLVSFRNASRFLFANVATCMMFISRRPRDTCRVTGLCSCALSSIFTAGVEQGEKQHAWEWS